MKVDAYRCHTLWIHGAGSLKRAAAAAPAGAAGGISARLWLLRPINMHLLLTRVIFLIACTEVRVHHALAGVTPARGGGAQYPQGCAEALGVAKVQSQC